MANSEKSTFKLDRNIPLSTCTTIGLGGNAAHFATCASVDELRQLLSFAKEKRIPVQVIGGGSNIIFADGGYPGVVCQVSLGGIAVEDNGEYAIVTAAAGEEWDAFVVSCIDHHLAGVECLSGIPGRVGASPIQNVGAYGQEVCNTIVSIKALQRDTLALVEFRTGECHFGYRQSRFKSTDADRFIITEVTFRLRKHGRPEIRYPELVKYLESGTDLTRLEPGRPGLSVVRQGVLALRKKKSMLIDPSDPHARSVGSFFVNPVLASREFEDLKDRWGLSGHAEPIPAYPAGEQMKIPAAWLVEHAGFHRGYRAGKVGISPNHALALVNYGGTTRELLDLARHIEEKVFETFAIRLAREPAIIKP